MKAIVGLGNPGREYEKTPHNAGFAVLDELAVHWDCRLRNRIRFRASVGKAEFRDHSLLLVRPETYMNNSGSAVAAIMGYYAIPVADLIVVLDDADLEAGALRIRARGSSGGHKGLASIVQAAGSEEFVRLRIGIGRGRGNGDLVAHVLRPLAQEQEAVMREAVDRAAQAVECILERGVDEAMNRFNARQKPTGEKPEQKVGGAD